MHAFGLDCLRIGKRVRMTMFVSSWHRTWLSLDCKEGAYYHVLSTRAIRLDCLWMVKKVRMTMFCLRVPSNLIVSWWWWKYGWQCFVSACHRTWLYLDSKKGADDQFCNLPFSGRATRGSRVHLPRVEGARSRHQRLFEENVRKTEIVWSTNFNRERFRSYFYARGRY